MSQDYVNGTMTNGARHSSNNTTTDAFALPGVDEMKLRSRIYCKPQLSPYPKALRFSGPTPVQEKKVGIWSFNILAWYHVDYFVFKIKLFSVYYFLYCFILLLECTYSTKTWTSGRLYLNPLFKIVIFFNIVHFVKVWVYGKFRPLCFIFVVDFPFSSLFLC